MPGVSRDACLKVKLLQSMMRMKPLTCSSGSSIMDSSDSRIARRMSTNEYLRRRGHQGAEEARRTLQSQTLDEQETLMRVIYNEEEEEEEEEGEEEEEEEE